MNPNFLKQQQQHQPPPLLQRQPPQKEITIQAPLTRRQFDQLYLQFQNLQQQLQLNAGGMSPQQIAPVRIPVFNSQPLDIYLLFVIVLHFGGVDAVHDGKMWKLVVSLLLQCQKISATNFADGEAAGQPASLAPFSASVPVSALQAQSEAFAHHLTSAGFTLNKHYRSLLEAFQVFYLSNQHQLLAQNRVSSLFSPPTRGSAPQSTSSASSQDSPMAPAMANSTTTLTAPTTAPSGTPSSSSKKIIVRPLDTFGGYDIDKIHSIISGPGEANTKRLFQSSVDLEFDGAWMTYVLAIRSGIQLEVIKSLKSLLILSNSSQSPGTHGKSANLLFSEQSDLFNELLTLWTRCIDVLSAYYQPSKNDAFWSYALLFEFELEINNDLECSNRTCVTYPFSEISCYQRRNFTKSLDYESKENGKSTSDCAFNAEIGLLISTCFRNWAIVPENSVFLARSTSFVNTFLRWFRFQPISKSLRDFDLCDHHATFLHQRKNCLAIYQCIGKYVELEASFLGFLINVLSDFIDPSVVPIGASVSDGLAHNLPVNSCIPPIEDIYAPLALEALSHFLSHVSHRSLVCARPELLSILQKTLSGISGYLPLGSPNKNQNSSYSDPGAAHLAMCALYRLSFLEIDFDETLVRLLARLVTGFAWVGTPTRSDSLFSASLSGAQEGGDTSRDVIIDIARCAARCLKNIFRKTIPPPRVPHDRHAGGFHSVIELDAGASGKLTFRRGAVSNRRFSGGALGVLAGDLELMLLMQVMGSKLPQDMGEVIAELLFILSDHCAPAEDEN